MSEISGLSDQGLYLAICAAKNLQSRSFLFGVRYGFARWGDFENLLVDDITREGFNFSIRFDNLTATWFVKIGNMYEATAPLLTRAIREVWFEWYTDQLHSRDNHPESEAKIETPVDVVKDLERIRCMVLKAGSPALHKMGDIGHSSEDEFIDVKQECGDYFIGTFCEGFGFMGVKFLKQDVKPLTESEVAHLNKQVYCIGNTPMYTIHVDAEGYYCEPDAKEENT